MSARREVRMVAWTVAWGVGMAAVAGLWATRPGSEPHALVGALVMGVAMTVVAMRLGTD